MISLGKQVGMNFTTQTSKSTGPRSAYAACHFLQAPSLHYDVYVISGSCAILTHHSTLSLQWQQQWIQKGGVGILTSHDDHTSAYLVCWNQVGHSMEHMFAMNGHWLGNTDSAAS